MGHFVGEGIVGGQVAVSRLFDHRVEVVEAQIIYANPPLTSQCSALTAERGEMGLIVGGTGGSWLDGSRLAVRGRPNAVRAGTRRRRRQRGNRLGATATACYSRGSRGGREMGEGQGNRVDHEPLSTGRWVAMGQQ